MKSALGETMRSRWLAGVSHAGLWVLLYLSLMGLRGKAPQYREADGFLPPPGSPAPVSKIDAEFTFKWPSLASGTNSLNAFYTKHFIPPPAPPPPAPTTRKIELTYLGYYETEPVGKTVVARMGDAFLMTPVGAKLTANLFAADVSFNTLLLTNAAAQTNILQLNTKKQLEVPIQ